MLRYVGYVTSGSLSGLVDRTVYYADYCYAASYYCYDSLHYAIRDYNKLGLLGDCDYAGYYIANCLLIKLDCN